MKVQLDLNLTPAQKAALGDALDKVRTYLTSAKIEKVLRYWPRLSDAQRQQVLDAAPLFARIVEYAGRIEERVG